MYVMKKMNREKKAYTDAEYRSLAADGYKDVASANDQPVDTEVQHPNTGDTDSGAAYPDENDTDGEAKQSAKTSRKDKK